MSPLLDRVLDTSARARWFIASLLVLILCFVLYEQTQHPYRYLAGDSFTYFTMVRKFHEASIWFSYSGIDHTMGIHLGYYLLLLPIYALVGIDLPSRVFILNTFLLLFGTSFLARAFGRTLGVIVLLGSLTTYGTTILNNGLESSLVFFVLSLLAWFVQSYMGTVRLTAWRSLVFGGLLGLLIMARLDLIFLVGAFFSVFIWQRFKVFGVDFVAVKTTIRELVLLAFGFGGIFLVIALLNQEFNGSIVPISGKLKSSFPHPAPDILVHVWQLKIFLISVLASGFALFRSFHKKQPTPFFLPVLFLGSGGLWLYNGLFASGIGAWYGVLPFFSLLVVVGLGIESTSRRVSISSPASNLLVGAVFLLISGAITIDHLALRIPDWISPHRVAATFLDERAMSDEAAGELKDGVFAYYARMPVYSLTGLANNQAYVEAVQQGSFPQYARERSIQYIIGGSVGSGVQVRGGESLFASCKDPFYDQGTVRMFRTESCFGDTMTSSTQVIRTRSL